MDTINLIRLFNFYLAVVFLFSFRRRYRVYWDAIRLGVAFGRRWPRLVDRLRYQRGVLLSPAILRPTMIALAFMAVQFGLSRLVFPQAQLTLGELADRPWFWPLLAIAAVPMIGVDGYFLFRVGRFDRTETETYLDQAEGWLGTWKAGLVRTATLGYVDPRRMVDAEVGKALTDLGAIVQWAMWWVTAQIICRSVFGLTLWFTWVAG